MATLSKKQRRTPAQLAADGFAALVEKLGMAEAVRYVQLYHPGAGDYTRERHQWLDNMSQDQIAKLLAETKKNSRKSKNRKSDKAGG